MAAFLFKCAKTEENRMIVQSTKNVVLSNETKFA